MEVTTTQLQSMLDRARRSERLKVAAEVEAAGETDLAESIRGKALPIKVAAPRVAAPVPEAIVDGGERDPLLDVDERVTSTGSILPREQLLTDEQDIAHLARKRMSAGVRD